MNINSLFGNAFHKMKERQWNCIYLVVDVHGTILQPSYLKNESIFSFYPYAIEALQKLSDRDDICLIMFTSSYEEKQKFYQELFRQNGINFKYLNENPEVENSDFACFDKKFYVDIGLDDKYGFEPQTDWRAILEYIDNNF